MLLGAVRNCPSHYKKGRGYFSGKGVPSAMKMFLATIIACVAMTSAADDGFDWRQSLKEQLERLKEHQLQNQPKDAL
ncbi:hypothetical protein H257_14214 [Aphanomyces astaci]|uniref:Uncharacterized protein n=1 Tax=Aphanomyces astaci TaxID=112090 RepID=W4FTB7_APHAT|nr:hypothetical protein H257_14214 [Aphanomyces astaci]ETV70181.1 hypothetical protein H257_14214 [Aphanomyces astaci]|eukprot:XP_009840277.1 hypothetical protein H257_14214 [Aphanomyces astaci]